MNTNILTAIANVVSSPAVPLSSFYESRNRMNNMGEALENYIKDAFAGTLAHKNEQERITTFENVFSYLGNQNNPPDIIIKNGDAIEVKKIESAGASLALNSSYPKAKLFADSPMVTSACRSCESWDEKDIIYAVGVVDGSSLSKLFFVYGVDYAASANIYERIKTVISSGVNSIPDVEFVATNELGRVNRVDPLGITYFRIRGMWGITNPARVFSYVYTPTNAEFELTAIINNEKYYSFSEEQRLQFESLMNTNYNFNDGTSHKCEIKDIRIKTPDNPSVLRQAKLITFSR